MKILAFAAIFILSILPRTSASAEQTVAIVCHTSAIRPGASVLANPKLLGGLEFMKSDTYEIVIVDGRVTLRIDGRTRLYRALPGESQYWVADWSLDENDLGLSLRVSGRHDLDHYRITADRLTGHFESSLWRDDALYFTETGKCQSLGNKVF